MDNTHTSAQRQAQAVMAQTTELAETINHLIQEVTRYTQAQGMHQQQLEQLQSSMGQLTEHMQGKGPDPRSSFLYRLARLEDQVQDLTTKSQNAQKRGWDMAEKILIVILSAAISILVNYLVRK